MPANKDFKRLVRARMQKTGEAYTAARAHLLTSPSVRKQAAPTPDEYARLAGMSDAAIKAKTGCTWQRWVGALDAVRAHAWTHREIAQYAHEKYKLSGWWAQSVAVGYERIKGLRMKGQQRGGEFRASKSKVFPVPVSRLYRSFGDRRARARWLPGVELFVRTATRDKSLRITWPDETSIEVGFYRKGASKSQMAISHTKLPDRAAVDRMKQYWTERFDALGIQLARGRRRA
jgi:hypothetical protein